MFDILYTHILEYNDFDNNVTYFSSFIHFTWCSTISYSLSSSDKIWYDMIWFDVIECKKTFPGGKTGLRSKKLALLCFSAFLKYKKDAPIQLDWLDWLDALGLLDVPGPNSRSVPEAAEGSHILTGGRAWTTTFFPKHSPIQVWIHPSIPQSLHPSVHASIYPSIHLLTYPSIYRSIYRSS